MKWSEKDNFSDTVDCPKHAPLVNLNKRVVIDQCGETDVLKTSIKRRRNQYLEAQHNITDFYKYNESFTDTLSVTGNEDYFIGKIKFNYSEFLEKLQRYLNATDLNPYSNHFEERMIAKISELRKITTKEELKEKFPLIYKDYIDGIQLWNSMQASAEFLVHEDSPAEKEALRKKERYYFACGLRFSLTLFVNEQANMYYSMLKSREEIMYFIDNHYLNGEYLKGIDKDKLELYVAYEYIKKAKTYKHNHPNKQMLLTLIKSYLEHAKNKSIEIDIEDKNITYSDIYLEYLSLTSSTLDWEILPEGETVLVKEDKEKDKHPTLEVDDLTPDSIKELTGAAEVGESENLNLYEANEAKIKFYQESGYEVVARGIKLNKGYTAFIYPNGIVVMDLIAGKENISKAIGNGIYIVNASEFPALSMLTKAELRSMKDKRIFLYHKGDWQERLQKELDKEGTPKDIEASEILVRALKRKRK